MKQKREVFNISDERPVHATNPLLEKALDRTRISAGSMHLTGVGSGYKDLDALTSGWQKWIWSLLLGVLPWVRQHLR